MYNSSKIRFYFTLFSIFILGFNAMSQVKVSGKWKDTTNTEQITILADTIVIGEPENQKQKLKSKKNRTTDSLKTEKKAASIDSIKQQKKNKFNNSSLVKKSLKKISPKKDITQFSVMSYNMKHGLSRDGKTNLLRLVELIRKYQPDLVALQEIDSGLVQSGKLYQLRIISLLTGYDEIYGKTIEEDGGNYGLGILTKHPYDLVQNGLLPSPEKTEDRNMLSTVITLPNNHLLQFCNTQLDYKSPLNRGIQAGIINKTLGYSLYPVLLCGNFNAAIDDHTINFLPKYWNDAGRFDSSPTHLPTERRIDYFWSSKNANFILCEYHVLSEIKNSVHYPILAVYELSR
jgi:endonuclease/exonuclease/phosphatase family metal-dependent hydrolase